MTDEEAAALEKKIEKDEKIIARVREIVREGNEKFGLGDATWINRQTKGVK